MTPLTYCPSMTPLTTLPSLLSHLPPQHHWPLLHLVLRPTLMTSLYPIFYAGLAIDRVQHIIYLWNIVRPHIHRRNFPPDTADRDLAAIDYRRFLNGNHGLRGRLFFIQTGLREAVPASLRDQYFPGDSATSITPIPTELSPLHTSRGHFGLRYSCRSHPAFHVTMEEPSVGFSKKPGDIRITVNVLKLDKVAEILHIRISLVNEVLHTPGGGSVSLVFGISSEFTRLTIHPSTTLLTTFRTLNGLYEWLRGS